jgi:hypothetical protein
MMILAGDPDYEDLSPAFPALTSTSREVILQPPRLQIQPSARILERTADLDVDIEAAG